MEIDNIMQAVNAINKLSKQIDKQREVLIRNIFNKEIFSKFNYGDVFEQLSQIGTQIEKTSNFYFKDKLYTLKNAIERLQSILIAEERLHFYSCYDEHLNYVEEVAESIQGLIDYIEANSKTEHGDGGGACPSANDGRNGGKKGNRNKTFASFVNEANDESINEILNGAKPLSNDEPRLADYFDTLVRTGKLKDIPSKGALQEKGISVSNNWKSLCSDRKRKR